MNSLSPIRAMQRYVVRIRAIHQEIRTARLLNDLPASIRKDIGWPDSSEFDGVPSRRR